MIKISLKNLNLKKIEQLSREQLKNVLGGYTGGTGRSEEMTSQTPKSHCGGNGGGGEGDSCITTDGFAGTYTSPYKNGWNWGCWKNPVTPYAW